MKDIWYYTFHNDSRGTNNYGYDDEEHNYILDPHVHLNYRYEVLKTIVVGDQGQVIECRDHKTNNIVVVKMLVTPLSSTDEILEMGLKRAMERQRKDYNQDSNVVKVLDDFTFRGHYCIVLELLKESLQQVIEEAGLRGLDMALIKAYTREILTFLKHMELKEAVHAAIRPNNIMVKDTVAGTIRVMDFKTSFTVGSQRE
ncbi:dual specificity tyrosine-phosphorylation-regulated kinase 2-like [Lampetra planeri]